MTAASAQKNTGKKTGKRGKAPGSAAHHFQPGQSGNPNGRPKGRPNYNTIADEVWAEVAEEQAEAYNKKYAASIKAGQRKAKTADDFPIPKLLIKKHTIMALAGDHKSLESVQDRYFGKAIQTIAGDPENPLEHSFESTEERAARMLAMFDVPVVEDEEDDDESEQDEVEPAAPAPKETPAAKKPAAVKKAVPALPGRKRVNRTPLPNRYTKKK